MIPDKQGIWHSPEYNRRMQQTATSSIVREGLNHLSKRVMNSRLHGVNLSSVGAAAQHKVLVAAVN